MVSVLDDVSFVIFPASYGESIFVSINGGEINLLIDAGLRSTYEEHIRNWLSSMNENDRVLDHLIITHIDSDHISGAISLLAENNESRFVQILNVWHNSYRHLQNENIRGQKHEASLRDKKAIDQIKAVGYQDSEIISQEQIIDISGKQGASLAKLIMEGGYGWNNNFNGNAVCVTDKTRKKLSDKTSLILLSPDVDKLEKLKKYWKKEFRKLGISRRLVEAENFEDEIEFMLSFEKVEEQDIKENIKAEEFNISEALKEKFVEDTSCTNGSSISFVIEHSGMKFLLLADSHPTLIEQQLRKHFRYDDKLWFDAIKLSHHGSRHNTSHKLLELIDSDTWFISTDGKLFNHPDPSTLARIVIRPTTKTRKLIFNYETDLSRYLRNEKLQSKFNYIVHIAEQCEVIRFT